MHAQIEENLKKSRQRLFFLRKLKLFSVSPRILINFYRCVIETCLARSILIWFNSAPKVEIDKLDRVVKSASYIIGVRMDSMNSIYARRLAKRTKTIMGDDLHPLSGYFELMPSGR